MNRIEKSVELFNSGFLCSQAVFAAFSKDLGLSEEQALKIGACFGSGMRKGEVCGACTGALMVLGRELLDCDISTPEGKEHAIENNLFSELCPKMVESAATITEKLI